MIRAWLRVWLGVSEVEAANNQLLVNSQTSQRQYEELCELRGRIEDLESAYPDYKKAKAEADEKKATEIVPGFRPFSRRKREWEASRRKPEKK